MNTLTRTRRRCVLGGASLAVLLALSACGGGTTEQAEPAAGAAPEAGAQADPTAFCEAVVGIDTAVATGPGGGPPPANPEQARAAMQAFGAKLEPLLAAADRNAPAEVRRDVDTLLRTSRQVLQTGDPSAFGAPPVRQADGNVDRWMLDNCGYEQMSVTAVDYAFEGVPEQIGAGPVAVSFSNEGSELHELLLLRINDGVTQPFDQLLRLPQQQAMQMARPAGAAFAPPGRSDTVFLDLGAGRYGVACFVPTGTTGPQQEGDGPPHAMQGMFAEMTVS